MAGLRVITAEASPSSLQSMMTVYPSSTSGKQFDLMRLRFIIMLTSISYG